MQNSSRQIKIGGIISYIAITFSIVSGLIYTPWMMSIIGQADYGLYTLATSLVTMVTIDLGLSQAVTRFVSKYRAENDIESINKFLGIVYKLFIMLSLIFLILLIFVYLNVDRIFLKLNNEEIEKVKILLSIAGFYAVVSFPFNTLDGLIVSGERFIFQKSIDLLSKVLNIVLMVIALKAGKGLFSLVIVNAIVGIFIIGIKLYYLCKNNSQKIEWNYFDSRMVKKIFSFSIWVMVITISQRLILSITPSILGITSGSKEIAIFSIAMTIEGYVWTFSSVFGGMFLPKVSRMIYGENANLSDLQALMIKVGRIQLLSLSAIISIFLVAGKDFIINWLGNDFENSFYITVLMILPGLITVPQSIGSTALTASNNVKYNAFSKIVVAVISICLSYFLSLKYGAIGSGIAIFIGNLIGSVIIQNIIYIKVLKIDIWIFFKECHLSMLFPFIIVILTGILLNYFIKEIEWINTIFKVLTLLLVYGLSSFLTTMNSYEKGLISELLKGKIN